VGASAALLHPVINLVLFVSTIIRPATSSNGCHKQNSIAKRCTGQGLQIQEQVRMLGFGHAYSQYHRRRAQPHGPRPRYCARKVGLCESHNSECLKV
jgi:hypothetical protein